MTLDVDPRRTHVVCIGIDTYEDPRLPTMPGLTASATRFAAWAVSRGVAPESVWVAGSWDDPATTALPAGVVTFGTKHRDLQDLFSELSDKSGDMLIVYWAGHGVLNSERGRVLFVSDSNDKVERSFGVENLQDFLASEAVRGFDLDVLFVDACANFAHEVDVRHALTGAALTKGDNRAVEQWTLYSAGQGEYATADSVRQTTAFSGALLQWLEDEGTIPIDFAEAVARVDLALEELRDADVTRQHLVTREVKTPGKEGWAATGRDNRLPVSGDSLRAVVGTALTVRQLHDLVQRISSRLGLDDDAVRAALAECLERPLTAQEPVAGLVAEVQSRRLRDALLRSLRARAATDEARSAVAELQESWVRHEAAATFVQQFGPVTRQQLRLACYDALPEVLNSIPATLDAALDLAASYSGPPDFTSLLRFVVALERVCGVPLPEHAFTSFVDPSALQGLRRAWRRPVEAEVRLVVEIRPGPLSSRRFTWPREIIAHTRLSDTTWQPPEIIACSPSEAGVRVAVDELVRTVSEHHTSFSVGFLVPRAVVDCVPESWGVTPNVLSLERPLWHDRTTTLHVAERHGARSLLTAWDTRVREIRASVEETSLAFDWIDECDHLDLQNRFKEHVTPCCAFTFALGASPAELLTDPLIAVVAVGAPYVLWMDEPPEDWTVARRLLDDLIERSGLYRLPELLRELRQRDRDGLGRCVRLVWDDPDALPPRPELVGNERREPRP